MSLEIQFASSLILITIFCIGAIIIDAFSGKNRKTVYIFSIIGLFIIGASAIYTLTLPLNEIEKIEPTKLITKGMLKFGGYASFFDILFCLAGIMTLFSSRNYLHRENYEYNEFYSILLFSISGMMLIAHTSNLLILFIGIEIMSISFYILSGFFRRTILSVESALKYFLLGAFATGFLLYGIALIYGGTGSIDLTIISEKIRLNSVTHIYLTIGTGLIIIGLCFKVAAFPFHQWAPDVYQGAPSVVTAFMSTAGKAGALIGFIIIARVLLPLNSEYISIYANSKTIQMLIALISAGTMIIGNITALVQKNVKRMLAYSSVAHAGYMLMGIVAHNQRGFSGIVFYATAYMFMQIGAFIIVSVLERKTDQNLNLSDYSGLSKAHPILSAMMAMFMLSLAGIPPMAGFFGKYYLFTAAIEAGFTWLTIVAVIASIVSMYFYIGLIVYMYFREPGERELEADMGTARITLFLSSFGVLFFGIFPSILIDLADKLF